MQCTTSNLSWSKIFFVGCLCCNTDICGHCDIKNKDWVIRFAPWKASLWSRLMSSWGSSKVLWWHSSLAPLSHSRMKMAAHTCTQRSVLHNFKSAAFMSSTAKTLPSSRLTEQMSFTAQPLKSWLIQTVVITCTYVYIYVFAWMRVQTQLEKLFNFSLFYIHVENAWHISFLNSLYIFNLNILWLSELPVNIIHW